MKSYFLYQKKKKEELTVEVCKKDIRKKQLKLRSCSKN